MEPLKEEIKVFDSNWKNLEVVITDSYFPIFKLEISGQTPEELLQKAVEIMESKGYNPNIYCQEWVILKNCATLKSFLMVHKGEHSTYLGMMFKIFNNFRSTGTCQSEQLRGTNSTGQTGQLSL